ncbi:MAG: hypothetical protein ACO3NK_12445 [Prochlorotrichaceae cyanobacterium]
MGIPVWDPKGIGGSQDATEKLTDRVASRGAIDRDYAPTSSR